MSVRLDIRGLPEVKKLLEEFEGRQLNARTRRALRRGGAVFRKRMRSGGPGNWSRRPKGFKKTRTRNHRFPLGLSVSPQSPLSTIFEHGAKAHAIPISTGPMAGRTVQHPGVRARPFVAPIFDAAQREAEDAFADELFEGIR